MRIRASALILLLCVAVAGCFGSAQPQQNAQGQTAAPAPTPPPASRANPALHAWESTSKTPVELAKNVVATNYLVLLDNSGSMGNRDCSGNDSKFTVAKKAIADFAATLPPSDNLSLAIFNDGGKVVVPFGSGPEQRKSFTATLAKLNADQGTPLRAGMIYSYNQITEQAKRQLGYGLYRLVVVTDGESTDGDPAPIAKDIVGTSPVEIYTIGFCVGNKHSLNVPGFTKYYTAANPQDLSKGLAAVQAEVASFNDAVTFLKN